MMARTSTLPWTLILRRDPQSAQALDRMVAELGPDELASVARHYIETRMQGLRPGAAVLPASQQGYSDL
jgi:hypothetical protein